MNRLKFLAQSSVNVEGGQVTMLEDLDNVLCESIINRMKFSSTSNTVKTLVEQEKAVGY